MSNDFATRHIFYRFVENCIVLFHMYRDMFKQRMLTKMEFCLCLLLGCGVSLMNESLF